MDSYRIDVAAYDDVSGLDEASESHRFRFPDDALDCAQALAATHGRDRVQCWFWASGFIREPDGTCEDASGWEWMSLADLEMDVDHYLSAD